VKRRRLPVGDAIALLAALALLLFMALDWYGSTLGDEARRIERIAQPEGALGGEVEREVRARAAETAEREEQNPWQADAAIDRVILLALVATAGLAIAAAFLRLSGRRFEGALTPSALAALAAGIAALLVAYRIVQDPGLDAGTEIKAGAPLALVALGLIVLGSLMSYRAEQAGAIAPAEQGPGGEGADPPEAGSGGREALT